MSTGTVHGQVVHSQYLRDQYNFYGHSPLTPLPPEQVATLLRPYRERLVTECRFLPLRSVQPEAARRRGDHRPSGPDPDTSLELERIFVELDTTIRVPAPEGPRGAGGKSEEASTEKTRPLPVLEAVAAVGSRHVVLHGAPGCGKSTFLRYLTLALAHSGLGDEPTEVGRLPGWPAAEASLLPIRIELRQFGVWLHERKIAEAMPCLLWNHLMEALERLRDRNSWRDLLPAIDQEARAGRVIFLLDGLDEVPGGAGKLFVRECIEQFAAQGIGQACRILVTCRTRSYEATYKAPDRDRTLHLFETRGATSAYELAPFQPRQRQDFVRRWYDALVLVAGLDRDVADRRTHALQSAVVEDGNRRLGDLAANPLLLTVIAHLHSSRDDLRLPDNRAELFHDLIDLLLTRWAERHRCRSEALAAGSSGETLAELLAEPGAQGFGLEEFRQLVAELAYAHYRGGQDQKLVLIPAETLRQRLEAEYRDPDPHIAASWARRVMDFIQLRAGLLNCPEGGDQYDFPHSLLGEYLAAYHLQLDRDYPRIADKVSADGNWDEVIRLVGGHYAFVEKYTPAVIRLVDELCRPAAERTPVATVTDLEWRRVALGADIVHELGLPRLERGGRDAAACRNQLRDLLVRLLDRGALPARDRARAGAVLGELGDPRDGVGQDEKTKLPSMAWIDIPAGPFVLGSAEGEGGYSDERPKFLCGLIRDGYRISRYPVTVRQFQAFIDAGGYGEDGKEWWTAAGWEWKRTDSIVGPKDYAPVFQTPNHPRVGVSWYEAVAFCRWLTKQMQAAGDLGEDKRVALPTEAQWERAARHTDGRRYPWGNEVGDLAKHCNMAEAGIGHTNAVGMFPNGLAACGAADLAGNVWEWCRTKRRSNYIDYERKVDDTLAGDATRVLRGGSWNRVSPASLSCSFRDFSHPDIRLQSHGFRCVLVDGGSA